MTARQTENDPARQQQRHRIIAEIDRVASTLRDTALKIHADPELGFKEYHASEMWSNVFEREGFRVERPIAGLETAFMATAGAGEVTVSLMLEYDALPDLGHACGHHLNGAAAAGAALGLRSAIDEIGGKVIAFGCPGEEGLGGKCHIARAGLLEGVDFAMMAHARDRNIGAMRHSAVAKYRVKFHGKSAHAAAAPDQGINALDAMLQQFSGISAMRQQMRDDSRIHGVIVNGGHAPNIIPDYTEALFYIRDFDDEYLAELDERFANIVEGAALQTGARAEIEEYGKAYRSNIPNEVLDAVYRRNAAKVGVDVDESADTFSRASTDMGDVSHLVPAIHPAFKAAPLGTPVHSRAFAEASKDEAALDSMIATAKVLALTAHDVIVDSRLRREMKEAHLS